MEAFDSALKRGEIKDPHRITKTMHVVCGCGAEGCIFIHATRTPEPERSLEEVMKLLS